MLKHIANNNTKITSNEREKEITKHISNVKKFLNK